MPEMTIQQAMDLAMTHHQTGQVKEAQAIYRQVLSAQPDHANALHMLGVAMFQTGDSSSALQLISRAISIDGAVPDFHNSLARILLLIGRLEESIQASRRAIELRFAFPEALLNLAIAQFHLGEIEEAQSTARKVIELSPQNPQAWNALGAMLREQGKSNEAIDAFQTALKFQSKFVEAATNLAGTHRETGRLAEAIEAYRNVIVIAPDWPTGHYNLALTLLLTGDFKQGWIEHEWRCQIKEPRPVCLDFQFPRWRGQPLDGKRLLIHCEQGFGDTIQFVRYVSLAASRSGQIVMLCQPELVRLVKQINGIDQVVTQGDPLPTVDFHCPLLSLPYLFNTELQSIPQNVPYISSDAEESLYWRRRLGNHQSKLKIGLVWKGGKFHIEDRLRSITFKHLQPLFKLPNIQWISLQKESRAEGILLADLVDWTDDLKDFADTAALVDNLDLVITVDTAVAHLAGAMGKVVWMLLPFVPDWRWMLGRDDSPWYPTIQLFRQPSRGDWNTPIDQVLNSLQSFVNEFPR
ncbi:MAG TPA: tetratricopeptide repeat protein [Tepidisphaeraceae bacterium]|nr:tetratricopeptide repeat protein [Tepidisphaeraceae bacterium]